MGFENPIKRNQTEPGPESPEPAPSSPGIEEVKIDVSSDMEPGIEKAGSFKELFEALRTMGGLRGSTGEFYSAEDLEESIRQVRMVQQDRLLKNITRTGGLREKVVSLLAKEREKESNE